MLVLRFIIYSMNNILWMLSLNSAKEKNYRQRNYCNNLATTKIPVFVVSKLSVGETFSKTVLPHFSKKPVAKIMMTSYFMVPTNHYFSKHTNYISLGCSLWTDQFLIKHYVFKIEKNDVLRQIQNHMVS